MVPVPLITTRFDATSTGDDVVRGVDLHGRQAVVTGGSSGLGAETARVLAAAGAAVTLAVRDRRGRSNHSLGPKTPRR